MNCNVSGSSLMFAVHYRGMQVIYKIITPESIDVLASYAKTVCASMGLTSSMILFKSKKLIEPADSHRVRNDITIDSTGSTYSSRYAWFL
jgi:hypothetical protein